MYRTNLFEYCDMKRIEDKSKENDVLCTQNGQRVSLIGDKKDIFNVLDDCFDDNYNTIEESDVILVNC